MAETCNSLTPKALTYLCEAAFGDCSSSAERTVRAYYAGTEPDLVTVAHRYAKREFGNDFDWEAAQEGCLPELMYEYHREH